MRRILIISSLALLALIASAGVANFVQLRDLRGLVRPSFSEPISLEISTMSTITRSKVINGETVELTCVQIPGETFPVFLRRCDDEWAALCALVEE